MPWQPDAEDAGPPRRQPGQVAAEHLVLVGGVAELHPGAGKDQVDFGHADTLRASAGSLGAMRLGVLDIGSNTGHLLVVDAHGGAAPLPAYSYKEPLRLAEHLDEARGGHRRRASRR